MAPLLLRLALLAAAAAAAAGLTFDLEYGARKCVSEDVPPSADVLGELHVSGGNGDMSLDLFVSDPRGVVYFHKAGANSVKYSFKAGTFAEGTTQVYRFCVVHQVHPNAATRTDVMRRVSLSVKVEGKGVKEEVERLAKKGDVTKAQEKFQDVYRDVDSLISRMDELRALEDTLSTANENTSRVVMRVTFLAAVFTIGTGVLNFLNLKSFFKSKKLA
jgi:emp24/gp25L/p24 family/GOLD